MKSVLSELGLAVATKTRTHHKTQKAPRYHVVLLNDDYTPMDFAVEVIQLFFHKSHTHAVQLMQEIHTKGQAICGTYTHNIAETKSEQVNTYARKHHHPLVSVLMPAEI